MRHEGHETWSTECHECGGRIDLESRDTIDLENGTFIHKECCEYLSAIDILRLMGKV